MSQAYHARPSQLLGVSDDTHAWMVDRAVWTFARAVENDQEVAVGRLPKNAKPSTQDHVRQRILDQYLGIDAAPGRYADPASASRRR